MFSKLSSYRPTRLHLVAGGAVLAVLLVLGSVLYYVNSPAAGIHAQLAAVNSEHVHVNQPVVVKFDQPVDLSKATVTLDPAVPIEVTKGAKQLVITPEKQWDPTKRYAVDVQNVTNTKKSVTLKKWTASFFTQPRVGVQSISVDGKAVDPKNVLMSPKSKLQLTFTVAMKTSTVTFKAGDQAIPAANVQWQPDNQTAVVGVPLKTLYSAFPLTVGTDALSTYADPFTDPVAAAVMGIAVEPTNSSSGINALGPAPNPAEIVVENSGAARPQHGLQQADIVYEYVSEYSIGRLTAIYFSKPPDLVGPVRSCRMINPYIGFAFGGWTMCSGASVGTLHNMFLDQPHWVPGTINDFDQGNHFFRSGVDGHVAPHNLFTTGDRALTLRQSWPLPQTTYLADPPHPDVDAGDPAGDVDVPLHHVSWTFDGGSKQYLRIDSGTPFVDGDNGQQVHAKNVVMLHVGFHDAGWVEDDNGGAHSIWYDLLGSGAAEIYSDGKVIHATWHMGADPGQSFFDNHNPVWFTDQNGNVVELNTGLTWIHVLGNGQTG